MIKDIAKLKDDLENVQNSLSSLEKQVYLVLDYSQVTMHRTDCIKDLVQSHTENIKHLFKKDIK